MTRGSPHPLSLSLPLSLPFALTFMFSFAFSLPQTFPLAVPLPLRPSASLSDIHTSAYVSIRQHALLGHPASGSPHTHCLAYVSIRQHTYALKKCISETLSAPRLRPLIYRLHTRYVWRSRVCVCFCSTHIYAHENKGDTENVGWKVEKICPCARAHMKMKVQ